MIQLPRWHGRVWQLLTDTSKVSLYLLKEAAAWPLGSQGGLSCVCIAQQQRGPTTALSSAACSNQCTAAPYCPTRLPGGSL